MRVHRAFSRKYLKYFVVCYCNGLENFNREKDIPFTSTKLTRKAVSVEETSINFNLRPLTFLRGDGAVIDLNFLLGG